MKNFYYSLLGCTLVLALFGFSAAPVLAQNAFIPACESCLVQDRTLPTVAEPNCPLNQPPIRAVATVYRNGGCLSVKAVEKEVNNACKNNNFNTTCRQFNYPIRTSCDEKNGKAKIEFEVGCGTLVQPTP